VQATTWLGADVATVLSGLGSRHWIVSYPPRIAAAVAEARAGRADGDASPLGMPTADSVAMVWEVADEAPLLKLLGRLAPLAGGEIKEEQGFRGLRLPGDAGAFVGRGHLVLAIGPGTLDKVLTAIRNPPAGDVSWRESDALRRARALLDLPPARLFAVGDARQTGGALGTLREYVAALEPGDVDEESQDLLAAGQKLLPTAAEMEGMFGVGAAVPSCLPLAIDADRWARAPPLTLLVRLGGGHDARGPAAAGAGRHWQWASSLGSRCGVAADRRRHARPMVESQPQFNARSTFSRCACANV
jgi:hypothetical protein